MEMHESALNNLSLFQSLLKSYNSVKVKDINVQVK